MKTLTLAALFIAQASAQSLDLGSRNWSLTGYKIDRNLNIVKYINLQTGNDSAGALTLTFPQDTGGRTVNTANYLTTSYPLAPIYPTATTTLNLTLKVVAPAGTIFQYKTEAGNTCVNPAHVRLFLEHKNDPLNELWRWWSNPIAYELADGQVTLSVPLTNDPAAQANWTSVYGKPRNLDASTLAAFADTLANIGNIGVTFGGGCFFGHGVYTTGGAAQFAISNYSIQ